MPCPQRGVRLVNAVVGMYGPRLPWAKRLYAHGRTRLRELLPPWRQELNRLASQRHDAEVLMRSLAADRSPLVDGAVLYDGMYDNPNYWLRLSLIRAALGLSGNREVGLIGAYASKAVRRTFANLGIAETINHWERAPTEAAVSEAAAALVSRTQRPEDILDWQLPYEIPAGILYDGILKRQRQATVDVSAPNFEAYVRDALRAFHAGNDILSSVQPRLVVLSHPFNFDFGSLAWLALQKNIDVVLAYGGFGGSRFVHMRQTSDLYQLFDQPKPDVFAALPAKQRENFAAVGRQYVSDRVNGRTYDIQARFAYGKDRKSFTRENVAAHFGWDPEVPIVGVYPSNWFDWPHKFGMSNFMDLSEWTQATLRVAKEVPDVNWLFKPHPLDEKYGGIGLRHVVEPIGLAPNIGLADTDWNNGATMAAIDAMITYHATAGVEFAAMGKPVLLPDHGKYDRCGFVRVATSRDHYLSLLRERWWEQQNPDDIRARAEMYSGLYFCLPTWLEGFVQGDDADQGKLYPGLSEMLAAESSAIEREIAMVSEWFGSGESHYHTYRMVRSPEVQLSNVMRSSRGPGPATV